MKSVSFYLERFQRYRPSARKKFSFLGPPYRYSYDRAGYPLAVDGTGDAVTGHMFSNRVNWTGVSKQVSNNCIAVRKVATPLRELTCHMGSRHTVLPVTRQR